MTYADRYREELAYFRADLPLLTGEKIEDRCHTLSLLLTAAVRQGELTTPAPLTRLLDHATAAVGSQVVRTLHV